MAMCDTCQIKNICSIYLKIYQFLNIIDLKSCRYYNGNYKSPEVRHRDLSKNYQSIKKHNEELKNETTCSICGKKTVDYDNCENCDKVICEECAIYDINSGKNYCDSCFNKKEEKIYPYKCYPF